VFRAKDRGFGNDIATGHHLRSFDGDLEPRQAAPRIRLARAQSPSCSSPSRAFNLCRHPPTICDPRIASESSTGSHPIFLRAHRTYAVQLATSAFRNLWRGSPPKDSGIQMWRVVAGPVISGRAYPMSGQPRRRELYPRSTVLHDTIPSSLSSSPPFCGGRAQCKKHANWPTDTAATCSPILRLRN
jgi:hypothetical protein